MKMRAEEKIEAEKEVLLMDDCPSHITPELIDLLTSARLKVGTCSPHTTDILQVLDLTLFGILKREGQYSLLFDEPARTITFVYNLDIQMANTVTPPNISTAFQAIDLDLDTHQP
jgi:hypothetical protein